MAGLTKKILLIDAEHLNNPEDPEAKERYARRVRILAMLGDNVRIETVHTPRQALARVLSLADTSPMQLPVFIVYANHGNDDDLGPKMVLTLQWFGAPMDIYLWTDNEDQVARKILDPEDALTFKEATEERTYLGRLKSCFAQPRAA